MIFELLGPKGEKYGTNRDNGRALPILKSGIALKEKLLTVKAENYFMRLKNFEKSIK